ncbi:hypothetical protein D6783_04000 [Candidatus Woesearchaeota archaeon]|nr:MAG: hypothetical protein D6783_04000 [Candidatus Woesearchaeota archaeon]
MPGETDIPEEERLRRLLEEREKKKRELEELERKKREELKKTEQNITTIEQELREIEEETTQSNPQENQETETAEQESLEEVIAAEKQQPNNQETPAYGEALEQIREGNANIYTLTDYNAYDQLKTIRDRLATGATITPQERELITQWDQQLRKAQERQDYIAQHDPFGYVARSEAVISQIRAYLGNTAGQDATKKQPDAW